VVINLPGFGRAIVVSLGLLACLLLALHSFDTYRAFRLLTEAKSKLELGRYDSALFALERAAQLTPGNAEIAQEQGKTYFLMHAFRRDLVYGQQALAAYQRAAALNPMDGLNYSNLGWAYMKLGSESEARAAFDAALARDPYNVYYLYSLGRLDEQMNQPDQAIVLYERALSIKYDPRVAARLERLQEAIP
jgi:tetratricopeptide (TPR) repeat protein